MFTDVIIMLLYIKWGIMGIEEIMFKGNVDSVGINNCHDSKNYIQIMLPLVQTTMK